MHYSCFHSLLIFLCWFTYWIGLQLCCCRTSCCCYKEWLNKSKTFYTIRHNSSWEKCDIYEVQQRVLLLQLNFDANLPADHNGVTYYNFVCWFLSMLREYVSINLIEVCISYERRSNKYMLDIWSMEWIPPVIYYHTVNVNCWNWDNS